MPRTRTPILAGKQKPKKKHPSNTEQDGWQKVQDIVLKLFIQTNET